jgi:hypothetical protein
MLASGLPLSPGLESASLLIRGRFAERVIRASQGQSGIVEPTYIYLRGVTGGEEIANETGVEFFSTFVELGVSVSTFPAQTILV